MKKLIRKWLKKLLAPVIREVLADRERERKKFFNSPEQVAKREAELLTTIREIEEFSKLWFALPNKKDTAG